MSILQSIIANKHREISACLEHDLFLDRNTISMRLALGNSNTGIIAEFKRRSPSQGDIYPQADVTTVVKGYAANGATACSVLTDTRYFGGSLADLAVARKTAPDTPMLCKDFIVNQIQVLDAKERGADAILLIARALDADDLAHLTEFAHCLHLEVLCEVHDLDDIHRVGDIPVDMIGVNSRDLGNFKVNLDVAKQILFELPPGPLPVAESGISSPSELVTMRALGYQGFLIGTAFMSQSDPADALKQFIEEIS